MPTPQGIRTVTLRGRFVEPDLLGTPLVGQLTFSPNVPMVTFPVENTLMAGIETASLDNNGEFVIDLPCTDTPGQSPDGWTYTVTEKLIGVAQRTYQILLPYTIAVVELADIIPSIKAPTYLPVVGPQGPPGLVTSVNGISAPSITLTAANVGAISASSMGAPGGVATLDGTGKLTPTQVPDLSGTYITVLQVGAANGVASLSAAGKVPTTQLDLATAAPAAIATTGAVGTSALLARQDHTHAGMSLTGNQTASGNKTFSGDVYLSAGKLGVGVVTGLLGRSHYKSTVDEVTLYAEQTLTTATNSLFQLSSAAGGLGLITGQVAGDTTPRFSLRASGSVEFGAGNAARDVTLYRSAAGILSSSGQFASDVAAPSAASHLTRKDYVDGKDAQNWKLSGDQVSTGTKTTYALRLTSSVDSSITSTDHAFQIGPLTGSNLSMDDNEINSFNNGVVSPLYIQYHGGDLHLFFNRTVPTDTLNVKGMFSLLGSATFSSTLVASTMRPSTSDQVSFPTTPATGAYTDFASGEWPSVTVTVPPSGAVSITVGCALANTGTATATAWAGWRSTGARVESMGAKNSVCTIGSRTYASRTVVRSGLTPGATYTIIPAYNVSSYNSSTTIVDGGQLIVEPLM